MSQFEPSPASLTPRKKALLTLQYIRKAAARLGTYVESAPEDEVPQWVLTRINQSGSGIGAAMNFLSFKQEDTTSVGKKK